MENYIINIALELGYIWASFAVICFIGFIIFGKHKLYLKVVKVLGTTLLGFSAITLVQTDTSYKHEPFDKQKEAQQISPSHEPIPKAITQDNTKEIKPNVGDFEKLKDYKDK